MKICARCKQNQSISEFHKSNFYEDGYRTICKTCRKIESKTYYSRKREELKEKSKQFRLKNPTANKVYYNTNQQYFENYRETHKAHYKRWRDQNRTHLNQWRQEKLKRDPHFKLVCTLRSRVSTLIKKLGIIKSDSTLNLLGCSIDFLKTHLENKFKSGMSWENYGKWHIDHIIPCVAFDLTKPEEQQKCFHYSNLQPLWAQENLKKSDRYF